MDELFHDLNFLQGLVTFKGVDMDALEGKGPVLTVLGEIYATEAALSDGFDNFVVLHDRISSFPLYNNYFSLLESAKKQTTT